MPLIDPILQTDTFDIWRQKDNDAINALNNEAINEIVQIINPLNDQDILVYNAGSGFFENTGVAAFVTAIIDDLASRPTDNLKPYYYSKATQLLF